MPISGLFCDKCEKLFSMATWRNLAESDSRGLEVFLTTTKFKRLLAKKQAHYLQLQKLRVICDMSPTWVVSYRDSDSCFYEDSSCCFIMCVTINLTCKTTSRTISDVELSRCDSHLRFLQIFHHFACCPNSLNDWFDSVTDEIWTFYRAIITVSAQLFLLNNELRRIRT